MKPSLLLLPLLVFISACSTHYSVGHGHGYHHRNHVSVSGHSHGRGAGVVGALIVGGLIGHAISEANKEDESIRVRSKAEDELENGYPINPSKINTDAEKNRFYQQGKDGNCYLMENKAESVEVIAAVPKYICQ